MSIDLLLSQVEDKILEVANLHEEVTTSDLQGIATVKAKEIIELVRSQTSTNESADTTIKSYSEALAAVKAASNMGELTEVNEKVETLFHSGKLKMSDVEWVGYTNAIRIQASSVALE